MIHEYGLHDRMRIARAMPRHRAITLACRASLCAIASHAARGNVFPAGSPFPRRSSCGGAAEAAVSRGGPRQVLERLVPSFVRRSHGSLLSRGTATDRNVPSSVRPDRVRERSTGGTRSIASVRNIACINEMVRCTSEVSWIQQDARPIAVPPDPPQTQETLLDVQELPATGRWHPVI